MSRTSPAPTAPAGDHADAELLRLANDHAAALAAYRENGEAATACTDPAEACAFEDSGEAAAQAMYRLEDRIFALPATTPDGWRAKARIVAHILGPDPEGTYEDRLARALLADLAGGDAFNA